MQAVEVKCGDHTLVRVGQDLYSFGYNTYGQLCRQTETKKHADKNDTDASLRSRATPTLVDFFAAKTVFACSIGHGFSLVLCGDGLYIAGCLLGELYSMPTKISFFSGRAVRMLTSGDCNQHFLALCDDGLFSMGCNARGQLGVGDNQTRHCPVEIMPFHDRQVTSIAAGHEFSVVVCEACLYTFGHGSCLGLGEREDQHLPQMNPYFNNRNIVRVACGRRSTLVLCDNGLYYFGQAVNRTHVFRFIPIEITGPLKGKPITDMAIGAHHYLVVCNGRELYTFGRGSHGELGHGRAQALDHPELLTSLTAHGIDIVTAGTNISILVTDQGQMYAFGDGFDGKLGNGMHPNVDEESLSLYPIMVPSFNTILEMSGYTQKRMKPLSLLPEVLTTGSVMPQSEAEMNRLAQWNTQKNSWEDQQRTRAQRVAAECLSIKSGNSQTKSDQKVPTSGKAAQSENAVGTINPPPTAKIHGSRSDSERSVAIKDPVNSVSSKKISTAESLKDRIASTVMSANQIKASESEDSDLDDAEIESLVNQIKAEDRQRKNASQVLKNMKGKP